jgi:hypothetical protein
VDDSKITIPVQACLEAENETMKGLAQKVSSILSLDSLHFDEMFYSSWTTGTLSRSHIAFPSE